MRSKQILFTLLIISMFILPLINFAIAAPDYVEVEEADEFIWNILIDDDPYEDYLEDLGYSEALIDNITDDFFEDELDTDVVGWKIFCYNIEPEEDINDNDYVNFHYRLSIKEEDEDWEVEDEDVNLRIWEYDTDQYVYYTSVSRGLFRLVVANNVKWGKLADELDDEYDKHYGSNDESAGAEVATDMYFFTQKENGISTYLNLDEEELDDFTSIAQFNDDSILLYYQWAYDDDPIIELTLQYRMVYQWWWVGVVVAVAAVVIVIVIKVIKKR